MEIYLDIVVILNFLVDFFLILATNRISGHGPGIKKAALASILGAVYAAGCILPGFRFLSNILWRLISFAIMSLIAFGWDMSALRRGVLFIFLSLAMGGIAMGIGNGGFWAVVMAALLVCLLCRLGFGGRPGQQHYIPVTILHNGKTLHLTALVDTGNTLRDPVSGSGVLVVDADAAQKLLSLTQEQLIHPIETVASGKYPGLRLIPYSAVGQSAGMLLGLRVQQLYINSRQENMIVAFAPQRIGQGRAYQALAGGNIG